jgi:hypothetical protein
MVLGQESNQQRDGRTRKSLPAVRTSNGHKEVVSDTPCLPASPPVPVTSSSRKILGSVACTTKIPQAPAEDEEPARTAGKLPGEILPMDFKLTPYTVVVGNGKIPNQSLGNRRLQVLVNLNLKEYAEASNKQTKTRIVDSLVHAIYHANGIFVKRTKTGRWYRVKDSVAREKVGYMFRDLLSDRYLSSSGSKRARRRFQKSLEAMDTHTDNLERCIRRQRTSTWLSPETNNTAVRC